MRSVLLSLISLSVASCGLVLPPYLNQARATLYGYNHNKGEFFPEANLTLSLDLDRECLYFRSVNVYRPEII